MLLLSSASASFDAVCALICKEGQVLNLPTTVNVHVRRQCDLLCQQCLATLGRSQLSD